MGFALALVALGLAGILLWARADRRWKSRTERARARTSFVRLMFTPSSRHRE